MTQDSTASRPPALSALMLGALGVVFGDIGTSPLYALKESFSPEHGLPISQANVLGILSLAIWSITLVVSTKYVVFVMRADNRGEGGAFALLSVIHRVLTDKPRLSGVVTILGLLAACLFYGDSVITPAMSVMSAIEGLEIALPQMDSYVDVITVAILIGLFAMQRLGTDGVGKVFGPITLVWFLAIGYLGVRTIGQAPAVMAAFSPHYAIKFLMTNGLHGFSVLGSVVLAITGAEALYADMGHFGRRPIRLTWYLIVLPSLILNYLGQGALILHDPTLVGNPFFYMVPKIMLVPMVILATLATIIASQAVISGAFSLTWQAIHLGFLPRMRIVHTSKDHMGQIYIPFVNWTLMVVVVALVPIFQTSSNLAAAYGVAVTTVMVITLMMIAVAMRYLWKWAMWRIVVACLVFGMLDVALFSANIIKVPDGGWLPLVIAAVLFVIMMAWQAGRRALAAAQEQDTMPLEDFLSHLSPSTVRVPGHAVFLMGPGQGAPLSLLHNVKHNKVIHERMIFLTVSMEEVPVIPQEQKVVRHELSPGVQRMFLRYGYMEAINIPRTLARATEAQLGFFYEPLAMSYFLSRDNIMVNGRSPLPWWKAGLFSWMARTAASATDYFQLPPNRVVELGGQTFL